MSWLGFQARIDAILHKIRHPSHDLRWRFDPGGLFPGGDITCETCQTLLWCRALELSDADHERIRNELDAEEVAR